MGMQLVDIMDFVDRDSEDNASFYVRAGDGLIALGMSLRRDGDMEVASDVAECEQLRSLLEQAITVANASPATE